MGQNVSLLVFGDRFQLQFLTELPLKDAYGDSVGRIPEQEGERVGSSYASDVS